MQVDVGVAFAELGGARARESGDVGHLVERFAGEDDGDDDGGNASLPVDQAVDQRRTAQHHLPRGLKIGVGRLGAGIHVGDGEVVAVGA